jgi:hypothetical protein
LVLGLAFAADLDLAYGTSRLTKKGFEHRVPVANTWSLKHQSPHISKHPRRQFDANATNASPSGRCVRSLGMSTICLTDRQWMMLETIASIFGREVVLGVFFWQSTFVAVAIHEVTWPKIRECLPMFCLSLRGT